MSPCSTKVEICNPPITQTISVNYQSTTGGYQTPTKDTITITSPVMDPWSPQATTIFQLISLISQMVGLPNTYMGISNRFLFLYRGVSNCGWWLSLLILKTDGSLHIFGKTITDNWGMEQPLKDTHPLKLSLPGSLKLQRVLNTH